MPKNSVAENTQLQIISTALDTVQSEEIIWDVSNFLGFFPWALSFTNEAASSIQAPSSLNSR